MYLSHTRYYLSIGTQRLSWMFATKEHIVKPLVSVLTQVVMLTRHFNSCS